MNANEIRQKYINFMESKGHKVIAPAALVPKDDPTTLFTGSGMQALLPYLLGETHSKGTRLTDSQPCVRVQDIEDVGDNRHTTFFEMLGNWSLGDYFKEDQIRWFFEFLTKVIGLDPHKIYVTCFIGDSKHGIERDDEAAQIWQTVFNEAGIEAKIVEIGSAKNGDERGMKPGERIFFYDDSENWWSRGGGLEKTPIGDPCGPDSEVFYDFGENYHDESFGKAHPASDSGRFIEIGNQVFMQYTRQESGTFTPLANKNVDFGGGLERIAAAALNTPDVFRISLMYPIIEKLEQISGKKYESNKASMRVIADHLRAATFLATNDLMPSNKEQGYVLRRLIRRAINRALDLGVSQNFIAEIIPVIAKIYSDYYPEVLEKTEVIVEVLSKEEKIFRQTLTRGLREMRKLSDQGLTGRELFMLHDTFGFPIEISIEEAYRQDIDVSKNWKSEFDEAMEEQRKRSQTATKGMFKGGLEGDSEIHKKYHTTAHILMESLRRVLGKDVMQRGCHISSDRIRLDFSYPQKLTSEQITQIEDMVNEQITNDQPITHAEYDTNYALGQLGATGAFGDKYGDKVTVFMVGDFSKEVCGGPHVDNTSEIYKGGKVFKITKEQSSSAGVRRIKAILE